MTPVEEQLFSRFPQPLLLIENNKIEMANAAFVAEFETRPADLLSVTALFPALEVSSAYIIKETRMTTPSGNVYSVGISRMEVSSGKAVLVLHNFGKEGERELTSEEALQHLFESGSAPRLLVDPQSGKILRANDNAVKFYGYASKSEFLDSSLSTLSSPAAWSDLQCLMNCENSITFETKHRHKSGAPLLVEVHVGKWVAGPSHLWYIVVHDISKNLLMMNRLALISQVFMASSEGILISDSQNRIIAVNPAFTAITGYREEEVLGKTPNILKSGRHDDKFYRELWKDLLEKGVWKGEIWNRKKSGEPYPEYLTLNKVKGSDGLTYHIGLFLDISDLKKKEFALEYMTRHDSLTGLPVRMIFSDRVEQLLANPLHEEGALIALDLDRFKSINETYGHVSGDSLIREVSARIKATIGPEDFACRQSGGEFLVYFSTARGLRQIAERAQELQKQIAGNYCLEGADIPVTASLGISVYPADGNNFETLCKNAEAAMHNSKETGRGGYNFYTGEMNARAFERLTLEASLHKALKQEEFILHYQPQVDLTTRKIIGLEALVRWQHPELGLVYPDSFIRAAEDGGLIGELGNLSMKRVCLDAQRISCPLAVNISALQIRNPSFKSDILATLQQYAIPAAKLELEITESLMVSDVEANIQLLEDLRKLGFSIAIDDFGTGYSSLSYLKRFALTRLKIDKSFVFEVLEQKEDQAIISAIIHMAHSLGLEVIAEGVETEAHAQFLANMGCDFAQGFLFCRPIPLDDLLAQFPEIALAP